MKMKKIIQTIFATSIFSGGFAIADDSECLHPEVGTYDAFLYSENSSGTVPGRNHSDYGELDEPCTAKIELKKSRIGRKYYEFSLESNGRKFVKTILFADFNKGRDLSCDESEDYGVRTWGRVMRHKDVFSASPFHSKEDIVEISYMGRDLNLDALKQALLKDFMV